MIAEELEVSNATRKDVWELLVNLERNVRYYTLIGDRHHFNYRFLRFGVLSGILFEGMVLYFAAGGNPAWWWVGGVVAFALAMLTVLDMVTSYADSAAVLKFTAATCDDLKSEVEQLWTQIETERTHARAVEVQYHSILGRWGKATQRVTINVHSLENEETTKAAVRVLQSRYGN